ncbi:MAG: TylF/MycF/NovP-related O-methyltransferase [Smithellaceae bacterium]
MKIFFKKLFMWLTRNRFLLLSRANMTYEKDLLYTYNNADFLMDPLFQQAYAHVKRLDKSGITGEGIEWRIHVLCWAAYHASHLDGDFVDCGVNTGLFSRAVMAYVNFNKLNKKYYLLDTFTGLDPKYSSDYEMKRHHKIGYSDKIDLYEQAMQTFSGFNTKIIKGAVPETLAQVDTDKVAYVSIDMNCVMPEVAALEFFWDRLVKGGLIILDDYAYPGSEDQKRAHDQFAQSKGVQILTLPTCQGLIIKP